MSFSSTAPGSLGTSCTDRSSGGSPSPAGGLGGAARHQVLREWNDTASAFPRQSLARLFAEQAAAIPDAVAVVWEGGSLSYGELARQAGRIARRLRQMGVGWEDRVGICAWRSGEMVAGLVGILEAGAAYVPLDPAYPRERLEFLLADVAPAALLGPGRLLAALPGETPRLAWEELAGLPWGEGGGEDTDPETLAYVLYTSGSTGTPKGVAVSHGAVARLVRETGFMTFAADEVFLQLAPLQFDASTLEVWGPLLNGGRLALYPPGPFSLSELYAAVGRYGVTTLWLTAGLFHLAVEEGLTGLSGLRRLLAGGDVLQPQAVERALALLPGTELINGYGPTENTTFSTTWRAGGGLAGPVPIGRPIAGSRAYVLDGELAPVPVGARGEICVEGAGLARGYLGRAELTGERFVPDPLSEEVGGGRLYRTGDLGRLRADGTLEFLGREDLQVKVRGFRIELGEVESALAAHPAVREVAVAAVPDGTGDRRLAAWYAADESVTPAALAEFLRRRLPGFMMPRAFLELAALPLTASGKVDRRALPEPRWGDQEGQGGTAPRTPVEERLAALWAETLGSAGAGVHDDFFERGGDSLLATRLVARIRQVFRVELALAELFEEPTVAGLARRVEERLGEGREAQPPAIGRAARDGLLPLSFAQQRLWFLDRLAPESALYNLAMAYEIAGPLSAAALAAVLGEIARRHEALRTRFVEVDGEPRQRVDAAGDLPLPEVDLAGLALARREELARFAAEVASRPFDLERGPLLRCFLVRLSRDAHVLLVAVHHIVYDGWSEGVLLAELSQLYAAALAGRASPLPELAVQYADFAVWQRSRPEQELAGQLAWWREELAGASGVLELPTDRPRPAAQSFRGGTCELHLGSPETELLRRAARQEGATLYMFLLAGFAALLARYSGQDDLLVGTPVAHRTRPELEGLIGFFVNTLVLRSRLGGDADFRRQLAAARATALAAFAHQDLPFEALVQAVAPERDLARNPLAQVMLALQSAGRTAAAGRGGTSGAWLEGRLRPAGLRLATRTAKFDLSLAVEEGAEGGLVLELEHALDLFHPSTAVRLLSHYAALLGAAAAEPGLPLSQLPLLSEAERHQALREWNDTAVPQSAGPWLHEQVLAQARADPGAPAVTDGERTLTYGELAARALRLAGTLRALGVGPEVRVGLALERSPELVVGGLAVLAAGGAYVALDPSLPEERLRFQLEDAAVPVLLTRRGPLAGLAAERGIRCLFPEEAPARPEAAGFEPPVLDAANLAYVIYTSGSTGRPKGVEVSHGALANVAAWYARAFEMGPTSRATLLSGVGFDSSVLEIWSYLAHGGHLHVVPEGARSSPEELKDWLVGERITNCWMPVPLAHAILDLDWHAGGASPSLRCLETGGEPLLRYPPPSLPFPFFNSYGPSECAVVATLGAVPVGGSRPGLDERPPSLGRPADNLALHVVDVRGEGPLPRGVPGELLLGGAGLARGYRGRPDLTAERFVPDPFGEEPGGRLYRTGDLVRSLADGDLEFLGRIDHQVKVRGFRIELGEIEAVLARHPAVGAAAVLVRGGALVAFVSFHGAPAGAAELAAYLGRRLPDYMVPSRFMALDALPWNASGKVDRRALQDLELPKEAAVAGTFATPAEELVAGLFAEVLGRPVVRQDDHFFHLGGHSLLVTRLLARLRRELGVDLAVRVLFESPTVEALAKAVTAARRGEGEVALPPLVRVPRGGLLPVSSAQRRLWFLDRLVPGSPFYNVPVAFALDGEVVPVALSAAFSEVVRRHEVLRGRFVEVDGEPWLEVVPAGDLHLPVVDLSGLVSPGGIGAAGSRSGPAERLLREEELERLSADEAGRPFDLAAGLPLRGTLVRMAEREHALLLTLHHIVADAWSGGVLARELAVLYEAALAGRSSPLPGLPVQYADVAAWERSWPPELLAGQLAYWKEELAGAPGVLDLPTDRPRPPVQSFRGARRRCRLAAAETAALRQAARREGVTLYMLLMTGFAILLSRFGGQEDLLVGLPVAHRMRQEVEGLIGFFVNTLVLRARLHGDPAFRGQLAAVRESLLAAFAHQDLPFETLVEELHPARGASRNPLVQVVLTLEGAEGESGRFRPRPRAVPETAKFDLLLSAQETAGGELDLDLEHSTDLWHGATAERLLTHFVTLVTGGAEAPDLPLSRLPLLSAAERHQVLREWNDTASTHPRQSLHRLFAGQAAASPDAVAVVWEAGSLSYGELARQAGRIARRLRLLGVRPEDRVGICAWRTGEMVAGLVGILEAGAAYVPLDPSDPRERLEFLLADVQPAALLGPRRLLATLPGAAPRLAWEELAELPDPPAAERAECPAGPESLAYVLYTSGSTGVPKGVAVPHGAVVRLVRETGSMAFGPAEVFLQLVPLQFDVSTLEIWGPLLNGGRLVLYPPRPFSLAELYAAVERHGVTTLWLTAGLFHLAVEEGLTGLAGLSRLLAGGDVLLAGPVERALALLPAAEVINGYGPTENTTFSSTWRAESGFAGPVPIGRPIAGSRLYVLDRGLEPAAIGTPGEICVEGAGLARGYLGRAELTAERFVPSPFAEGESGARLYRTGDLGSLRADGTVDFLGRRDFQVKVRGFRIEPGEVESVLAAHPAVREAVVVAVPDASGDRRLAAFYVAAGAAVEGVRLASFLRGRLPEPLVPQAFVALVELPLNANGKVDRKALAARGEIWSVPGAGEGPPEREAPRTPLEEKVAEIWLDVLGLDPEAGLGLRDDFFDLGGHSLLATRVVSRLRRALGVDLPLRDLFEAPTLAGFARRVEGALAGGAGTAVPPLVRAPRAGALPLSFAQQRLWFLDRLAPASPLYNIPQAFDLEGPLDLGALAGSLAQIVCRHEVLRSRIVEGEREPRQEVLPATAFPLPLVDLAGPVSPAEADRLERQEAGLPFHLAAGPPLRGVLLKLSGEQHRLFLTVHHVAADAWSLGVLVRELPALYAAAVAGRPSPLAELPLQYADFAAWQRAWPPEVLAGQLDYWRRQLDGAPRVLELPTDRARPPVQSFRGASRERVLPPAAAHALRRAARREGGTLYVFLLAGFAALLARHGGQDDLLLGMPVANRTRPELEGMIGFFVNTLVLRARPGGEIGFRTLSGAVREAVLGAFAHQDLPFELLVEELKPERDLARSPLVQVVLTLADNGQPQMDAAGLRFAPRPARAQETAKFDLALAAEELADGALAFELEYAADLFHPTTAQRLLEHLETLLTAAAAAPERALSALPLLSAAERHQLLAEWNDTARALPAGPWVHERVGERARRLPEALAVVEGGRRLSYGELMSRARALAGELARLGVGPEVRVGLGLERSADLVVSALAVLLAGGAYVALDPASPVERLAFQLADARAPVLLTRRGPLAELAARCGLRCLFPEEGGLEGGAGFVPPAMAAGNLAYVIYTSGSTGRPKGVEVSHGALANLVSWHGRAFAVTAADRATLLAGVGFDAAVWETWPYLAAGASLHVVPESVRTSPAELSGWLSESGVTVSFLPVPLAEAVMDLGEAAPRGLRHLLTGGDRLGRHPPPSLPCALWNDYGPTEGTVVATAGRVPAVAAGAERAPTLGRPVDNVRAHVVAADGGLVARGVAGELRIGGAGLARGYLGRADLTAERFVPDPFGGEPGGRLYRSGDLVRSLPDGELEFLGRIDHQVKIRGFRIELGEVEGVLLEHPRVRQAVVAAPGRGEPRLVAYVVPAEGGEIDPDGLRGHLRDRLPDYMVPQAFVALAALPLNASGKVDRRALPAPGRAAAGAGGEAALPRNPLEERLAALWGEVLGGGPPGIHDDFFAAGGHSLLATQLIARIRQALGIELPLRTLFQKPTVAALAAEIIGALGESGGVAAVGSPIVPVPRDGELPLSFSQLRLWFLAELEPGGHAFNVPLTLELRGALSVPALLAGLGEIVRRHETLRTTFTAVSGRPEPRIAAPGSGAPPLDHVDLSGLPEAARQAESRRLVQLLGEHVFDLTRGPLLDLTLLRLSPAEHLLQLTVHHIVFDGWSLGVFLRELAELYRAAREGRPSPLPELAVQYVDYAAWQRGWLAGEGGRQQSEHWRSRLAGAPALLHLPTDRPRPAVQTYRGGCEPLLLPARLAEALAAVGAAHGATLFMTLLAGFSSLLERSTRQRDVNVGTFAANRRWQAVEPLLGFFVNTLVLRTDLSGEPTFGALLERVRDTTLAAFENQDFPFERLLEELGVERDLSRTPLFQVMLVLQNFAAPAIALPGLTLSPADVYQMERANFDLSLFAAGGGAGSSLVFEAQYNRGLFDPTTIRRLLSQLAVLLEAAAAEPGRRVCELPLLSAAEHQQMAVEWIAGGWPEAPEPTLPRRLLEAQAACTPEAAAVVAGDGTVTYGELERRVKRLARRLHALGVGPESLVGITVPRSPEMVIGVLAVLEAGAGYLPLDPDLPAERFAFLLEDSRAVALLGVEPLPAGAAAFAGPVLLLGEEPLDGGDEGGPALPEPHPSNLAYVIYTSGSTGRPKGVQCLYGALARFITAAAATYGIGPGDRVLQFASLSFDVSLEEIFPCLATGGTLVLREDAMMASPARFLAACGDHAITVLDLPTAYWHILSAELLRDGLALPESLRLVIIGGERPLPERVAGWLEAVGPHPRLWNTYGPTEATVMSTAGALGLPGDPPVGETAVPLGLPWGGSRIWLLDAHLSPVPLGASGEMHIAGPLLARGYLGRPELTAAAFVPCPFGPPGERLYRSGDLARHRPRGYLEFVGRVDDQVKIRGFRVEPGEVAAVLARHPGVGQAAVLATEAGPGDWRLVAYCVAGGGPRPTATDLRDFLKAELPAYMVPADFVELDALPMTATGKLDTAALPRPEAGADGGYAPPETAVEELLVDIWQDLLRRDRIGIYDNLFDLGGHSLLVPQIVARIEEALELELPLRSLFEAPTVAELAVVVESALLAQIEGLSDEEAVSLMGHGAVAVGSEE